MEITDITGRKVKTVTIPNHTMIDFDLSIGELAAGIYCCKISSEKVTITKKIIKY